MTYPDPDSRSHLCRSFGRKMNYVPLKPSEEFAESKHASVCKKPSLLKRIVGEAIGTSFLMGLGVGCTMANQYVYDAGFVQVDG